MADRARASERLRHPCDGRRHSHDLHPFLARIRTNKLFVILLGIGALIWLLVRSGPKPTRLSYPCQQSAFGLATAAFGIPFVIAIAAGRAAFRRALRSTEGRIAAGGLSVLLLTLVVYGLYEPTAGPPLLAPPPDYHPSIFVMNDVRGIEPGRFGGVDDLLTLMGVYNLKWHRSATTTTTSGPDGIIDRDDVVLIKVNSQWSQRGGTNTEVLRGIIRRIVEHPDGFIGEIVVADNGQGVGSLNRSESNAEDHGQSVQDVVDDFDAEGWTISTELWDGMRTSSVAEYSSGNNSDGYIVASAEDPETEIHVSYPKFRTSFGTSISYKNGIWDPDSQTYDHDRLVVINVPVLKTHSIYGVTGAVKNHMGVITQSLGTDSHYGVARGGLGSIMADVRPPDITILDCIWVLARPGLGPSASYANASRRDQLVAGTDPVALDMWAVKNILIPQIQANGYTSDQYTKQDPDNPNSTFRSYLDKTMSEMIAGGISTTNDPESFYVHVWEGPNPIPAASTWALVTLALLLLCTGTTILRRTELPN